jgi:hypothetical protein
MRGLTLLGLAVLWTVLLAVGAVALLILVLSKCPLCTVNFGPP